jgi:hypothetical protein
MNDATLNEVLEEMNRLENRIADLQEKRKADNLAGLHGFGCPESGAVRRASMDLTRALAKLRRGQ